VDVLVRLNLRGLALSFVVYGAIFAFSGWNPIEARVLLVIGLGCALIHLWVNRQRRGH
jgi:hypothetical protein